MKRQWKLPHSDKVHIGDHIGFRVLVYGALRTLLLDGVAVVQHPICYSQIIGSPPKRTPAVDIKNPP